MPVITNPTAFAPIAKSDAVDGLDVAWEDADTTNGNRVKNVGGGSGVMLLNNASVSAVDIFFYGDKYGEEQVIRTVSAAASGTSVIRDFDPADYNNHAQSIPDGSAQGSLVFRASAAIKIQLIP